MLIVAAGACGGGGGKSDDAMVQRVVVKEADGERERVRSPMDPVQGQHTGAMVGSPASTIHSAHTTNIINITSVGQFYAMEGTVEIDGLNHDRDRKRRRTWRTGHSVSEAVVNDLNVGAVRPTACGVKTSVARQAAQRVDAGVGEHVAQSVDVGVGEHGTRNADVGVQTEPMGAHGAQGVDVGVGEHGTRNADVGVQTEPELAPQVADVGVQTEPEPAPQVADVGVQTEPEPAPQVADVGVQTELMEAHEAQGQYVGSLWGNYDFTALVTSAGKFYAIYAYGDDIGEAVVGDLGTGNGGTGILYLKERLAIKVKLSTSVDFDRSLPSRAGSAVVSVLANQFPRCQSIVTQADNLLFNPQSIHIVASADGLPPFQFRGNADIALYTKPTVSKVVGIYKGMSSKRDYLVNEINMPSIIEMTIDGRGRITGKDGYCSFVGRIVPREWGNAYDIEIKYADEMMCSYQNSTVRGVGFYIEKEYRLRAMMQTSRKGGVLFNVARAGARQGGSPF
ncbi:hypothetical protein KQH60_08400 [Mycetohabitans sp. B8]|uniref:hypothetical protein n=1 Tax=Mycetohabitans sp. B8 TaxID=2841845 RepID=UPI001F28599D|nr:hypothetical protein [Mycetohabitans sp. B8]MCG1042563.1 hypothetical protein [Mycetohabitans sp. B8]